MIKIKKMRNSDTPVIRDWKIYLILTMGQIFLSIIATIEAEATGKGIRIINDDVACLGLLILIRVTGIMVPGK